jgi:hypothetical protein
MSNQEYVEDEINLMDYFIVLWKRKWFIFLASVLPALVVGLTMFHGPRNYKISYTYNVGLNEKAFKTLEDRFYSAENLEKFVEKLQEDGFEKHAKKLAETGLKKFVSFEISPSYFEAIKPSKAKNLNELQKFQEAKGSLLVMQIGAQSKENIRGIASVCRKNFEQIIPLYSEIHTLNNEIIIFKGKMAGIEEARYTLSLQLERKKFTMEKLKNFSSEGLSKLPSGIVLQFDSGVYLPLPYQIQAAEIQIINLEEQIRTNKENYDYYVGLLKLNEKLFSHAKKIMLSHSTLEQFRSFLITTLSEYKENNRQLLDYLKAYIKRIENKIANVMPLIEKPMVYPVAKGTVKKSAIVFVMALMMSVFAAFLFEGIKKIKTQTS